MGFFDFRNRQDEAGAGPLEVPAGAGTTSTRIVQALLAVPRAAREEAWAARFLAHVADAAFFPGDPAIVSGPDRLPLFALHSGGPEGGFPSHVLHHMKDEFLLERGLGAVINPGDQDADWAFSYGDILHFHLYGRFYPLQQPVAPAPVLDPAERLPRVARNALRAFLQPLGVAAPGVLLAAWDHAGPGSLELLFDFSPQEFTDLEAFRYAMSHISWFLPRNYSYSVAGNQARNDAGFQLL